MPFSKDETDRLKRAMQSALASISLNQWQRTFITDMQARFEKSGPRTRLSDKQYAKLKQTLAPFEATQSTTQSQAARPRSSPRPVGTQPKPRRQKTTPRKRTLSPLREVRKARRTMRDGLWIVMAIGVLIAVISGGLDPSGTSPNRTAPTTQAGPAPDYYTARDFSITDGDTVQIYGARKGTRLVGFNTPETYQPQCNRERALGQQATDRLENLVRSASQVQLRLVACACPPGTQGTNECNFGRSCGVLRVDGRDVGDILVSEGLAAPFQCGPTSCPRLPRPWCG